MKILPYLKLAAERKASDIFFTANSVALVKINGEHLPVGRTPLTGPQVREMVLELLDREQAKAFDAQWELDFATVAGGFGRFRVNAFHQRRQPGMVLRLIASDPPTIEQLKVPSVLKDVMDNRRGLIVMVGATGSGKSSTLAAMINHRNEVRGGHILTLEDPIEFSHPNKRCIINQREVGMDTVSFERALKSALRQAPDVVLLGESRDHTAMGACLQMAGTGHLVLTTLHATNCYQACQRIIRMFPPHEREQLYLDLSLNLRAVIAQRLIKAKGGGRVAAVEIMLNTPYIAELIANAKFDEIKEVMADTSDKNIQTFDTALMNLYRDGLIDREEALINADSRAQLETRMDFG